MDLIADGLLAAGALGAAFYCFILSRRLSKFNDLENGVGGAVAVLSAQVDDLTKALERARRGADRETEKLGELTERAEAAAKQLELMMAAMHDLPDAEAAPPRSPSSTRAESSSSLNPTRPRETSREDTRESMTAFHSDRHATKTARHHETEPASPMDRDATPSRERRETRTREDFADDDFERGIARSEVPKSTRSESDGNPMFSRAARRA